MRFSSKTVLRVAAVAVAAASVGLPLATAQAASSAKAPPTIVVAPDSNLTTGATVTVSGSGFPQHNMTIYVLECSGTGGLADCALGTLNSSSKTSKTGTFSGVTVTVTTGTVGSGSCAKVSSNCIIAASTSTSGVLADSAFLPLYFGEAAPTPVKTKTAATASSKKVKSGKKFTIAGTVKSAGKGVSGLSVVLSDRASSKKAWKKVSTIKTKSGGKFTSAKLKGPKKSEQYEVTLAAQVKGKDLFEASQSKVITVKS